MGPVSSCASSLLCGSRLSECRPKHVGGVQCYNKQFKCILLDFLRLINA